TGPLQRSLRSPLRPYHVAALALLRSEIAAHSKPDRRPDSRPTGNGGVGVHSLRKTALTNALENGAPIQKVQQLAGHADIRTTQLYFRPSAKDSEDAARHIHIVREVTQGLPLEVETETCHRGHACASQSALA